MPASIFSETELARLASFPEEIPGDDLIRAFTLTGADRDLVAIRRGATNRLGVVVLLKGLVRSKTLLDNWDELLRVAGSLKLGWVTASLLISKLQAGARENVLSRALRDLGRLVKTQFILRWIENPDYRRRIHRQRWDTFP